MEMREIILHQHNFHQDIMTEPRALIWLMGPCRRSFPRTGKTV